MEDRLPLVRWICNGKAWPPKTCLIPGWSCVQLGLNVGQPGSWGQEAVRGKAAGAAGSPWREGRFLMNLLPEDTVLQGRLGGKSRYSQSCSLLWIYGLVFLWAPTKWIYFNWRSPNSAFGLQWGHKEGHESREECAPRDGYDHCEVKDLINLIFGKVPKLEAEEKVASSWCWMSWMGKTETFHPVQKTIQSRPKT